MNIVEQKLITRLIQKEDIHEIVQMAQIGFDNPEISFEAKHYESHITIFPEGQVCIEYEGKIIGSSSSLIVNYEEYGDDHSFAEISGNNYITNHNPNGHHLYGIDVVVHPDYQHLKIGRRLYEERRKLCKRLNLKGILFGGRIPHYFKYAKQMSADEYVKQVEQQKIYDPVLRFQLMNGFKIRGVKANYLKNDWASLEYATLLEWENIDYVPNDKQYYHHSEPVRIASIQYRLKSIQSFEEFSNACEYFINACSKKRVDFAVFPELITLQLLSFTTEKVPSEQVKQLTTYTNDYKRLFSDLAIRYSINIIAGSHYIKENGHIYNVAFLFHRNGKIDQQYKIQITPYEKNWVGTAKGNHLHVFHTDCGNIAILLGYDSHNPELARIAADKGAQIIFIPFSAEDQQSYLRIHYCARARAIENQVFSVICGSVGNLTHVHHMNTTYAQSAIFSPIDICFPSNGVVAQCEANAEAIVYGDVDLELLRRNRLIGTVTPFKDRRKDLSEQLITKQR